MRVVRSAIATRLQALLLRPCQPRRLASAARRTQPSAAAVSHARPAASSHHHRRQQHCLQLQPRHHCLQQRRQLVTSCSSHQPAASSPQAAAAAAAAAENDTIAAVKRLYDAASQRVAAALQLADVAGASSRLAALEHESTAEGLWDDPQRAQALAADISSLREELRQAERFSSLLDDAAFALELAELEADTSSSSSSISSSSQQQDDAAAAAAACSGSSGGGGSELSSLLATARQSLSELGSLLDKWELRVLLAGPYDESGALLTITAGAGGVDAMDWAAMLERMYLRWAAAQGFSVTVCDRNEGEEAGIKGVELQITGRWAYGYLKGEKGTHRLVRSSPFNAKGLRQTSFAGVEVMPVLAQQALPGASGLVIPDKDLEEAFMRSGGKGGQNVNKVETGVRLTHLPTGLAVKCTEHRTQQQNRAEALSRLTAKLLVVLEEQQAAALADIRGDIVKAEWGQQIRNYVMHPYKLVKDTRTGHETSDVGGVMDGGLEEFITAFLRHKGRQQQEARLAAPTS